MERSEKHGDELSLNAPADVLPRMLERKRFRLAIPIIILIVIVVFILAFRSQQAIGIADAEEDLPALQSIMPADVRRCAECHPEQVDSFLDAPHFNSLHRATDPLMIESFAGLTYRDPVRATNYRIDNRDGQLWLASDVRHRDLAIPWIFGSGTHAQTPLILLDHPTRGTESIEAHISWYPHHGAGTTLGNDPATTAGADTATIPGTHHDHHKTMECFGCHTSWLPVRDGQIASADIVPAIHCERCHRQTSQHLIDVEGSGSQMERWSELSPSESVNRCGQCHRRADQFLAQELTPDNPLLVRFAGVGIAMSPCFQGQITSDPKSRFDCLSCHDPHAPAVRDPQHYLNACLRCHGTGSTNRVSTTCSTGTDDSNCLACHMPRVRIHEHLSFTDHWIRVRGDSNGHTNAIPSIEPSRSTE